MSTALLVAGVWMIMAGRPKPDPAVHDPIIASAPLRETFPPVVGAVEDPGMRKLVALLH